MNAQTTAPTRETLPLLMSATEIQKMGFSRSMAYQLLNRKDVPVVKIGGRKFINRDKFFIWLDNQSGAFAEEMIN